MEDREYFEDVIALLDTYVLIIENQHKIIDALKHEVNCLRKELNLPSHIITSPPTPFNVDTCAGLKIRRG
jgi:hypothetical protein